VATNKLFLAIFVTCTASTSSAASAQPADAIARCNAVTVPQFRASCFEAITPQQPPAAPKLQPKPPPAAAKKDTPAPAQSQSRQAARDAGYLPVDFNFFFIDSKDFMGSKVIMDGVYSQFGEQNEYLFRSSLDAVMAKQNRNPSQAGIGMLTEDADRNGRLAFLTCRQTNFWCPVMILGRISVCQKTTILGTSTVRCLEVNSAEINRSFVDPR
jgi:hypothetical protein